MHIMKTMKRHVIVFGLLALIAAVSVFFALRPGGWGGHDEFKPMISNGVYGRVYVHRFDPMPKIRRESPLSQIIGTVSRVFRKNHCYECERPFHGFVVATTPLKYDENYGWGRHLPYEYVSERAGVVARAETDENGFYELELAPGNYSIFPEYPAPLIYYSDYVSHGIINLVVVGNNVSRHDISIETG